MLKRFISILLTVVMVSTLGGGMNIGQNVEVKAATAGITNGATYTIVSAYNGKAITQTDLSTFYANCVVWNTDAMSDLARWTLKETGDYYNITNVVSGKSIKITGKNSGDNMDFNGNDNSNNYRWKLVCGNLKKILLSLNLHCNFAAFNLVFGNDYFSIDSCF